jgi:hypothetical protein
LPIKGSRQPFFDEQDTIIQLLEPGMHHLCDPLGSVVGVNVLGKTRLGMTLAKASVAPKPPIRCTIRMAGHFRRYPLIIAINRGNPDYLPKFSKKCENHTAALQMIALSSTA